MLVVVAKPGDEVNPMGALIDRYAKYAILVGLICATKGTDDAPLARAREVELRRASRSISVSQVYLWSMKPPLASVQDELTKRITQIVRLLQPQVVISLSPSADAEITAVARAVAAAVPAAADERRYPDQIAAGLPTYQASKLYYFTTPTPADPDAADYYPPTTVIQTARSVAAQRGAWAEYHSLAASTTAFEQEVAQQAGKAYLHLLQGTPSRRTGQPFEEDLFAGIRVES